MSTIPAHALLKTLTAAAKPADPLLPRADRYLARVDLHLAKCETEQQRLQFLSAQIAAWTRAYARFVCARGGDTDPPVPEDDPPTASDYLLTILGLSTRQEQVRERLKTAREVAA